MTSMSSQAPLIPRLVPTPLTPIESSRTSDAHAFLETIDRVEINHAVERNGVVFYVLDVFLKHHSSRIPTNTQSESRSQPDYRVVHLFRDFADLRYQVWSYAQRRHSSARSCSYCDEYMRFIIRSLSQPRRLLRIGTSVAKWKVLLTTFCNEFIRMALGSSKASRSRHPCNGYSAIPHIMEAFLRQRF